MTVKNVSVYGQCAKCRATFTLELLIEDGLIKEIEPYRGVEINPQSLTHLVDGGAIRLFSVGCQAGKFSFALKKTRFTRERKRAVPRAEIKPVITDYELFEWLERGRVPLVATASG